MGILEIMEEINQEENPPEEVIEKVLKFENHPIENLDLEIKISYLNGLALMMNVDDEIHEKEKEYLLTLINTFSLSEDLLIELIEFSKNPNKEEFLELLKVIKRNKIMDKFLVDLLMISYVDNKYLDKEKKLFETISSVLKIEDKIIKEIELFVKYVYLKTKKAYKLLKKENSYLKFKDFEYLLKFYNIKEDKLNEGDYRIYFDEYFSKLKDDILFFGDYDYENGLSRFKDVESLFFGDYDYENQLNEFM